jgi:hypothetical protein
LAEAVLTLGPTAGQLNKVEVTFTGLTPVIFSAMAAIPSKVTKVSAPIFGTAGRRLHKPIVVRVMDANGKTISGCPVIFKFRDGNGKINGVVQTTVRTDSAGEATVHPVLGPTPGAINKIDAWVSYNGKILPSPVLTFTITAANLKKLVMVSGNDQSGLIGKPLAQPFMVKVLDSLGFGVHDQTVKFQIKLGGGKLYGVDTVKWMQTDSFGVARVKLTLGSKPGPNQVTASTTMALAGSPVLFVAHALVPLKTPSAEIEMPAPKNFVLQQNYPNPFWSETASPAISRGKTTTQIFYELPQTAHVTLTIYNALGQEVRKLVDGQHPPGYHFAVWNGRDHRGMPAPSGIYHYRLQAGDFVTTKKMLITK